MAGPSDRVPLLAGHDYPSYFYRRLFAGFSVLVGVAGAAAFLLQFGHRWQVAVLALMQGAVALINYIEAHYRSKCFRDNKLPNNHAIGMRSVGAFATTVALLVVLTYLTLAIQRKDQLTGESYWINAIWGFLLGKWGIVTFAFGEHISTYDAELYHLQQTDPLHVSVQENREDFGSTHIYSGLEV